MLKAVIDTSVMVSVAFAKEGSAKKLRDLIAEEAFMLVASREIMAELYRVLRYPRILKQFQPSREDIEEFVGIILEKAFITEGLFRLRKIKEDPTDDMFLASAMEAKADFIVSRDPHRRNLKQFHGIEIIGVKGFIEKGKKG